MSKVKFGAFVTDMRGKAGGSVFSKNRGGAYVKNKVTPVNGNTPAQQAVRASLAFFAQGWRGLSDDQRRSWTEGSVNFPMTNVFGDQYFLSGNMLFNRLNSNLAKVGQSALSACPSPEEVPEATATIGTWSPISLELDLPATDADTALMVRATAGLSAGVSNFKSKLRDVRVIAPSTTAGPVDIYALYSAKFGAPVAGTRIGIAVYAVNVNTGQEGVPVYLSEIVS